MFGTNILLKPWKYDVPLLHVETSFMNIDFLQFVIIVNIRLHLKFKEHFYQIYDILIQILNPFGPQRLLTTNILMVYNLTLLLFFAATHLQSDRYLR